MAGLEIQAVTRRFGDTVAVDEVSLAIADGEFVALLGPSGCGKTTLLRLVAGFEEPDAGTIRIGGEVVAGAGRTVPPERRRVGMVFQSYALWPHMTVAQNVGYPLRVQKLAAGAIAERVAAALATVGLGGFDDRRPAELSGGQRQRTALARCLVMAPALVLLDEPLANLDVHLRAAMEEEFRDFHRRTGATMVYVTHDQAEAMALADRIAVLHEGRLRQLAAPRTLYREPADGTVAGFIGEGVVLPVEPLEAARDGHCLVRLLGQEVALRCAHGAPATGRALLRPEDLRLVTSGGLEGRVRRAIYKGPVSALRVGVAGDVVLRLVVDAETAPPEGAPVRVAITGGWLVPAD